MGIFSRPVNPAVADEKYFNHIRISPYVLVFP